MRNLQFMSKNYNTAKYIASFILVNYPQKGHLTELSPCSFVMTGNRTTSLPNSFQPQLQKETQTAALHPAAQS
jgi:hypothetical protein